jgi:hypothetical protein
MQVKLPESVFRKGAIVGGIAALVVLAISGAARYAIPAQARPGDDIRTHDFKLTEQNTAQYVPGNCNNFGNNNVNCNTFNGPVARHLLDSDKTAILSRISKSRKVTITFQTTESDGGDFANEIYSFLKSNGYSVDQPTAAMMFGQNGTPKGVNVNLNDDNPNEPVAITIGIR